MAPSGGTDVYESPARCSRWRVSETVSGEGDDGPPPLALLPKLPVPAEGRVGAGGAAGTAGSPGSAVAAIVGICSEAPGARRRKRRERRRRPRRPRRAKALGERWRGGRHEEDSGRI
jgi:hypothetical protein